MGEQIIRFLDTQTDKLILAAMMILIIVCICQTVKMGRTNRQLKYLTDRLTGYLKAVLEDEEEELPQQEPESEFVSRQEQDMRDALELQKQQKKLRDAQVFDAVLSEMYP